MFRPIAAIAAAASTLCIGLAASVAADAPDSAATASESGIDVQVPDSNDRLDQSWTADRMRAAKPMPKPVISRKTETPPAPQEGVNEAE